MAQAWDGFFMHSYFENGNDLIFFSKEGSRSQVSRGSASPLWPRIVVRWW